MHKQPHISGFFLLAAFLCFMPLAETANILGRKQEGMGRRLSSAWLLRFAWLPPSFRFFPQAIEGAVQGGRDSSAYNPGSFFYV